MILSRRKSSTAFIPEVGMIYKNQNIFYNGEYRNCTFMVLRQATREEYIEDCRNNGVTPGLDLNNDRTYWKVSTD